MRDFNLYAGSRSCFKIMAILCGQQVKPSYTKRRKFSAKRNFTPEQSVDLFRASGSGTSGDANMTKVRGCVRPKANEEATIRLDRAPTSKIELPPRHRSGSIVQQREELRY
jgi:hypothetical protein